MQKHWNIKELPPLEKVSQLSLILNDVGTPLATLLIQRGINDFEKARKFFRPDLSQMHNPFLMKDMDKAVERLEKAILNNEKILIYGDYDVDGTTSVAMVYSFLAHFYNNLEYYIPDRYSEGYGISYKGIDYAEQHNFSLIIALDCGIKAVEKIEYANQKNIDFIICDHHRPGEILPSACAVLDPKRNDCNYPYKDLSGCGVGFKLLQAYAEKIKIDFKFLEECFDLLAISICADIVPITAENRVFVAFGLKRLNNFPRPGIVALKKLSKSKNDLTVSDVVFQLAPRINAAGRMENGTSAVKVLLAKNEEEAEQTSDFINSQNINRQGLDKNITLEAINIISNSEVYLKRKSTVVFKEDWHKGVVGIVASRLIETYYKPTIVLTQSNGTISGSARSVKGFDVYNAIDACSELLEQFGGHMYAAGLTLKHENLEKFICRFEEVVSATIQEYMLTPEEEVDAEIEFADISKKFVNVLKQFAPFGPENMNPIFIARNVYAKPFAKVVGKNHLQFKAFQQQCPEIIFSVVGFGFGHALPIVTSGKPFDMLFHVGENLWNDKIQVQLKLIDIRKS
jgi:single-stranded-DNA-specific exonuclease